ncbi:putative nuclease HARBI1 [Vanessa cardui]|uniref:putative nuclease HARBI1 n=1 Tax=Vanessa cardui TaxID=171605 RepID=UPI001F132018|nr:putative nuclease HARBI1 [Vanessa cardui]
MTSGSHPDSFYEKFHIPGVIGCIDETYVAIIRPNENEDRYFCRKGFYARNVMLIVDADLNILHVDASYGGSSHDSFIYHLSILTSSGEVAYLLGDSGYPQRPYLMTPVSNALNGTPEAYYNHLHASARDTVERAIGVLKARFRCLLGHRVLHYNPEKASKIIIACCVLHNICNRAGLSAPVLRENVVLMENTQHDLHFLDSAQSGSEIALGRYFRGQLISNLWRSRNDHLA